MAKKKPTALNEFTWKFNPACFNYGKRHPMEPKGIVIHCSDSKPSMQVGVDRIDYWHRQRGFSAVGYHFVIRRSGAIEAGRPLHEPGAHAIGYNRTHFGICLEGGMSEEGLPENNFTDAQWRRLYNNVFMLTGMYHLSECVGHRDLPNVHKECPCFSVADWLDQWSLLKQMLEDNRK